MIKWRQYNLNRKTLKRNQLQLYAWEKRDRHSERENGLELCIIYNCVDIIFLLQKNTNKHSVTHYSWREWW